MSDTPEGQRIDWYRSPIDRKTLSLLNQRSDWQGFAQTIGHLGLLMGTGASAWLASKYLPLWALLVILFIHGTFFAFLLNAFHEFCHKTVFKTKALNIVFLYIVSFLSWNNPVFFWASHQEHHKYTLHPPRDLEVVLPIKMTLTLFLKSAVINPWDFIARLKSFFRHSFGKLEGEWENALFPETEQALRRSLFNWSRFHLIGHALIVIVSLYFDAWIVLVVFTLAPFYGGALQFLCNNTQHIGLQDNVSDFRLCTRTIYLNQFIGFLYWYMHFHTEHHMYAAVPCYNLAKLHEQIKADLPPISSGLVETWNEIIAILAKQKLDPSYQYIAQLPQPSNSSKV